MVKRKHNNKKGNSNNVRTNKNHGGCKEIVFDEESRRQFLQGFSQRKQQRRCFGLAMQKVKDRKAKLEQRAELRKAQQEQIEEAEQAKGRLVHIDQPAYLMDDSDDSDSDNDINENLDDEKNNKKKKKDNNDNEETKIQTFQDQETQKQWGGSVIVTTSTHIPGEEESDNDDDKNNKNKKKRKSHDIEQEYAGNVEKYIKKLKGHMPSKKNKKHNNNNIKQQRKGKHGASTMKGVGTSSDLKVAQKVLAKSTPKMGGKSNSRHNNKRKR